MISIPLFSQDFYDIEQINEIELIFPQENWDQILDNLYAQGNEGRLLGTAIINGVQYDNVGVRYKGSSSYSPFRNKNPFNIKLDYMIEDQKIGNYGTIKLANGYHDPSMVRETLAYEIARKYMPAGFANYANVTVNGELIGIYTSCQDVDSYFGSEHFDVTEKARFKGYIEEGSDSFFPVWGYEGTNSSSYEDHYKLESDEGWDKLVNFLDVFNNDPDSMEDVLNVDNHLWFLAFSNLLVHLDGPINFGHNYYLFEDAADRFNPILWDMNMAFGGFPRFLPSDEQSISELQQLDPLHNIDSPFYPIIARTLGNDSYRKRYIAHMRTMVEEIFDSGWYETRANELQDIIDENVQNDPNFFYSFADYQNNIYSSVIEGGGGPGHIIVGIVQLMIERIDYLLDCDAFDGTVPAINNVSADVQSATPGEAITITATVSGADDVYLGWRDNRSEPFVEIDMTDNFDSTYGASITAGYGDIDYYVYAENIDQGIFYPERAQYEYETIEVIGETGVAVINEINYNSPDDANTEDWIEIFNPGTESVNLSGWIFKDSDDDHAFQIPDGTILEAGSYLVIVEDADAFTEIHPNVTNYVGDTGFGLSGGGELIRLFDPNDTLVDFVEYDDNSPWPTEPDGDGPTLELMDPTMDNSLGESWQASYMDYGTPGAVNSAGQQHDFPTNLVIAINGNDIEIDWDDVPTAVQYHIYRGTDPYNLTLYDSVTASEYLDVGAATETMYFYKITASHP